MANNVDALYIFLLVVSALMSVLIFTMVVFFAVRYRKQAGVRAEQIDGSHALEITWSVIPFCVFMVFFVWGAALYFKERRPPQNSAEVYTVAKQWMWKFEHMEGQREINELHVPIGRDVKMIMTSQDVIHSFYVPAFRIKQDVLPGRYTVAVVPSHQGRNLSPVLRGVLRNDALGHGRLSGGNGAEGLSKLGWVAAAISRWR